jgi:hypothetical protein
LPDIAIMKLVTLSIIPFFVATSQAALVWTVGLPGDGWPQDLGEGGGPETIFVQEAGTNDLPGDPESSTEAQQSDDDYYFAGIYSTVLDGGDYEPIGTVEENEIGAERAFAGIDNALRYHFNLPTTIGATTPLSVSWDANNLHTADQEDPRYGVEVYFNGNLIAEETLISEAELGEINTTPTFTLADVNGKSGEGFDNYVELRGINYNADGGGNWMGLDHVSLEAEIDAEGILVATDVALILTGAVQMFELVIRNASQDDPLTISEIEIAGDSASKFSIGTALPFTIDPEGQQTVEYTFDPMGELGVISASFIIKSDDPDIEDVSVALAGTIHDPKLESITAIAFGESETSVSRTLEISNTGLSQDLVIESITFTGGDADAFSATNPGTIAAGAMGQSTVTFTPPADSGNFRAVLVINSNDPVSPMIEVTLTVTVPSQETLVWTVGLPGDGWPQDLGEGGGPETIFVQESGTNDLPGDPENPAEAQQSDDDYYFAGIYTTILDGGDYEPIGTVDQNEIGAERAFAGSDNALRYHFNLPGTIGATTPLWVSWDANNLHVDAALNDDPRYGVEVYFNGNLVAEETLISEAELGVINSTSNFTLADVNGMAGEGFDNYVELRGINYNGEGGGNWMGIDHVSLVAGPGGNTIPFQILQLVPNLEANSVTITWTSTSGEVYIIQRTAVLADGVAWNEVDDGVEAAADGDETSYTDESLEGGETTLYYRIERE